jgi:hypothetical protein
MATIIVRATKDAQLELARKWGFPAPVFAGATFGLGVTMMFETGHTEEQIVETVRRLIADLAAPPFERGAMFVSAVILLASLMEYVL